MWFRKKRVTGMIPILYSPEPHRTDIEREIVKWLKQKQLGLSNNEKWLC